MKALITGMHGSVAPALAKHLADAGHETAPWNRSRNPIDTFSSIESFILQTKPDWFFHIATGSLDWAEMAAQVCRQHGVKFLYTSSVSVFAHTQRAPLTVDTPPEASDDYGRYKQDGERRVRAAHADAIVARLGWQIGTSPGSNNMVDYLDRTAREKGQVDASRRWFPSCTFLADTADALTRLMTSHPAGLYQLEGNPGLSFYEIARSLNRLQGSPWKIVPTDEPVQDNRMADERIRVRPITERFKS